MNGFCSNATTFFYHIFQSISHTFFILGLKNKRPRPFPPGGSEVGDRTVPRQTGLSAAGRRQRPEQRTQTADVSGPLHPQQGPHPAAGRALRLPRPHVSDWVQTLIAACVYASGVLSVRLCIFSFCPTSCEMIDISRPHPARPLFLLLHVVTIWGAYTRSVLYVGLCGGRGGRGGKWSV